MANNDKKKKNDAWAEVKRRCKLTAEDIARAKALGLQPKSLLKNIPSKSQPWKAPVREWVRDLYEKKFGDPPVTKSPLPEASPPPVPASASVSWAADDAEEADEAGHLPDRLTAEDRDILRKRKNWIKAAKYVAWEARKLRWVQRVALFGSLAGKPEDGPWSGEPKLRHGATVHDPKDIDLAIWISELSHLRALQRARVKGLQRLLEKASFGVAHTQVDVFLIEPGTDRYLGRLCMFKNCPVEGKLECLAPGCGASPFLQQHEGFALPPEALAPGKIRVLFDRSAVAGQTEGDRGLIPYQPLG